MMHQQKFSLPSAILELIAARDALKAHYQKIISYNGGRAELKFTLDGNLVGDIGEALSVELFGIRLVEAKSAEAIDGVAPDGRTVQIKATGCGRGPAFRLTETRADHLLFFDLDFTNCGGAVVYNGPEHYAFQMLPETFTGQRSLTANQIRRAALLVREEEQLAFNQQIID